MVPMANEWAKYLPIRSRFASTQVTLGNRVVSLRSTFTSTRPQLAQCSHSRHVFDQPNSPMDVMVPHIWSQWQMNGPSIYRSVADSPQRRSHWETGWSHFGQLSRLRAPSSRSVATLGMCLTSPILQWMSWSLTYGPNGK